MHRSLRGFWTLVLALALLVCAPTHVRPVWADPGGIGADPVGGGPGEGGDPDMPTGGGGKGGPSGGSPSQGGMQLEQRYTPAGLLLEQSTPIVWTAARVKAELYLHWIQLAIRARGW